MNLQKLGIIISREYLNKVKKKSFLLITFLAPLLFAGMAVLPTVIMMGTKEEAKKVGVLDASGIVAPYLENNETVQYVFLQDVTADEVKADMPAYGVDVLLTISALNPETKSLQADCYSPKPLGVDTGELIENRINDAVEAYRIGSYGIDNLQEIMAGVKSDIKLHSYTIDESGRERISESSIFMLVSMLLGMALYMFIALFSGMVMSSVIEEKSSRVVEVLVSSVKATELMFGKIIGVALVALTQFLLWIVLTMGIVTVSMGIIGKEKFAEAVTAPQATQMTDMVTSDMPEVEVSELQTIVSTLSNIDLGQLLLSFLLYFIFGYLLYASLFAAIGSAVENEGDSSQLQLPVTIPLLLAFFVAIYAFKAPDSQLVFWFSMIPFTSPIVMLARIPFGVATWELVVSIAALVLTFVGCAWVSAKIYKVGILMYG
ncbi:MAG: ABC transporter permease, partial [Bacteroidales bacterium]|nr:ABC transporter permease [Bacteroidales bacterium]